MFSLSFHKEKTCEEQVQNEMLRAITFTEELYSMKYTQLCAAIEKFFNACSIVNSASTEPISLKILENFFLQGIDNLYHTNINNLKEDLGYFVLQRNICRKNKDNTLARETLFKEASCHPFVNGFSMHAYIFLFYLCQAKKQQNITIVEMQLLINFFYTSYILNRFHSSGEIHAAFLRVKDNAIGLDNELNNITLLPLDIKKIDNLEEEKTARERDLEYINNIPINNSAFLSKPYMENTKDNKKKAYSQRPHRRSSLVIGMVIGSIVGLGLGVLTDLFTHLGGALGLEVLSTYTSLALIGAVGAGIGAILCAVCAIIHHQLKAKAKIENSFTIRSLQENKSDPAKKSSTSDITLDLIADLPSPSLSLSLSFLSGVTAESPVVEKPSPAHSSTPLPRDYTPVDVPAQGNCLLVLPKPNCQPRQP